MKCAQKCRSEAVQQVFDGDGTPIGLCDRHYRIVAKLPRIKKPAVGSCVRCQRADGSLIYRVGDHNELICKTCWKSIMCVEWRSTDPKPVPKHLPI